MVLGLYNKVWSATTCALKLATLASKAFRNPGPDLVNLSFILKWIYLILFGRLYSARGIKNALKRVFEDTTMGNQSYATTIGTGIGILAANVEQPSTHVFTNYNGVGDARVSYFIPRCDAVRTQEV